MCSLLGIKEKERGPQSCVTSSYFSSVVAVVVVEQIRKFTGILSFSIGLYSGVFKDTFSIHSSPHVSIHLYQFINKIYSCLAEMYHLLPRFLLQVNASCQGSCPGLWWLSMTYLYAAVRASLSSERCIRADPHTPVILVLYPSPQINTMHTKVAV